MHDEASTDVTESSTRGISRRSVVRTSAHLAWAVPAVQLATAAPALAVSGPAQLVLGEFNVKYTENKSGLDVKLGPVRNRGGSDAGQITAIVSVPKKARGPLSAAPQMDGDASAGWSFAGRSGNGPWEFTFVSNDAHVRPGERTKALKFDLNLQEAKRGPAATITVTVVGAGDTASSSDTLKAFK